MSQSATDTPEADTVSPDDIPEPPALPALPNVVDVPRDSAVDAEIMAATILAAVQTWAPAAVAAQDFQGAAELRRRLSPVASAIYRRNLSRTATLDAQHAARIADRVGGLTIRAGQAAGLIKSQHKIGDKAKLTVRDVIGNNDRSGMYRLADPTDEEFNAAVVRARAAGSLAMEALCGALGIDEKLSPNQRAQRDRIAEMAEQGYTSRQIGAELSIKPVRVGELARRHGIRIPGDAVSRNTRILDPSRIITEAIPIIDGLGVAARQLNADDIAGIDAAQAKDWARQLWDAIVPVMALQRSLRDRGKEA